jgi:hypothetical protein
MAFFERLCSPRSVGLTRLVQGESGVPVDHPNGPVPNYGIASATASENAAPSLLFNPQKQMTLCHRQIARSWLASHDKLYFMSIKERPKFAGAAFEPDRH